MAFQLDAFAIALGIGMLFSVLLRAAVHRTQRQLKKFQRMKQQAGGTLMTDVEADWWLKLIQHPQYRPIWRWYYGRVWNEKYAHVKPTKKSRMWIVKSLALAVALMLVFIMLFSFFGLPSFGPGPIEPETRTTVVGSYGLDPESSGSTGTLFELQNTTGSAPTDYPGGWAGLVFQVTRTDRSSRSVTVMVNITSGVFSENGTQLTYLLAAWLTVFHDGGEDSFQATQYGQEFGFSIPIAGGSQIGVLLDLYFRAFDTSLYERYVTIWPQYSDFDSIIGINGGHYTSSCSGRGTNC